MAPKKSEKKVTSASNFKRYGKHMLRHCPDKRGNFLWVLKKGPQKDRGYLQSNCIAQSRDKDNCEAIRKLQNYLSETGATISLGLDYLSGSNAGDALQTLLQKAEGTKFVEAMKFFNRHDAEDKKKDEAEDHAKACINFLEKVSAEDLKTIQQAALDSARVYGMSMCLLEFKALVEKPEAWNSKIVGDQQKGDYKSFQKKGTLSTLRAWIASAATKLIKDHDPVKSAHLAKRDDMSEGENSSEEKNGSASSSSSSSSSSDKKKGKKYKKKGKDKKDKKDKKDAKKKDKKKKEKSKKKSKKTSSSSSSSSPAKSMSEKDKEDEKKDEKKEEKKEDQKDKKEEKKDKD